jgi:preprotein translocase subunit SecG
METLITIIHLIAAVSLITLVLIQDSKGGGALGIGGGGANSLLGATGAQTLAAKMTRFVAIVFALTCLTLTWFITNKNSSVIDGQAIPVAAPAVPTAAPDTAPAAQDTAPAATSPATPAPAEPKK